MLPYLNELGTGARGEEGAGVLFKGLSDVAVGCGAAYQWQRWQKTTTIMHCCCCDGVGNEPSRFSVCSYERERCDWVQSALVCGRLIHIAFFFFPRESSLRACLYVFFHCFSSACAQGNGTTGSSESDAMKKDTTGATENMMEKAKHDFLVLKRCPFITLFQLSDRQTWRLVTP